jgi:hypothetical protein
MQQHSDELLELSVRDATGQKPFKVSHLDGHMTVGDLVAGLVPRMGLNTQDGSGREHTYEAFLEREGRHLNPSETVNEALQTRDEIVLQPYVAAGNPG